MTGVVIDSGPETKRVRRLVGIGLEPSLAGALARAVAESAPGSGEPGILWSTAADPTQLAEADIVLCAPRSAEVADRIAAAAHHADLIPMTGVGRRAARLADFDSATPAGRDALALAAGALGRAGLPIGPDLDRVLGAAGDTAQLVPTEAGGLRSLMVILQCLAHPSPTHHRLLVAWLRHAYADPDAAAPPLPTPHPRHGFWTPEQGVTNELPQLSGSGPVTVVAVPRSHVCADDDDHLRELWRALERHDHRVVGWFGRTADVGADLADLLPRIGIWINTRSYTLTGGDGSPELDEGMALLEELGTPQLSTLILHGQTRAEWEQSRTGASPATLAHQVAIPELQGGVAPIVIATRAATGDRLEAVPEQCEKVARLARRWLELAATPPDQRELAVVVVAHDPDKGKVGTASMLDVWESLWRWLVALHETGHDVELPGSGEELLAAVLEPPADGVPATHPRVLYAYPAADYVRDYAHVDRVITGRGAAPGEFDTDGVHLFVHGARFGKVTVICQPSFGYGADPATLLFNPDASPTHAFAATYTWISHHLRPHALLHFGTHGALEFMPGTQVGLKPTDYSDHLVADIPHLYLYVASNPSEAAIAKRRSYATIVNHLNPPLDRSELYGDLSLVRADVTALLAATDPVRRDELWQAVRGRATELGLDADVDPTRAEAVDGPERTAYLTSLFAALDEIADSLVSMGLHVLGEGIEPAQATAILTAAAELGNEELGLPAMLDDPHLPALVAAAQAGEPVPVRPGSVALSPTDAGWHAFLSGLRADLARSVEVESLLSAHQGRFVLPGPGGDPVRHRDMLPTGRNTFSVDPLRIPTPRVVRRGRDQAEALLAHAKEGDQWPETVSIVVWGIDTIKTLGEAPAQVFALLGVEPYADAEGAVTQLRVIPLEDLGRPRIDVVVTTSGVFRDMFPATLDLLDEAVRLVAQLDEPDDQNYLRRHCRQTADELGIDLAEAATRVFSSLQGRYGTGVSHTIDAGAWDSDADLGETYLRQQGHAYGRLGGAAATTLLRHALARVDVAFQNIDGAEQSLADNDDYLDHLGGMAAAISAASGGRKPRILTADNYSARARVRDLDAAIRLESRTRMLNPKWHHAMLEHGFQGVHEVAVRLAHTYGWAATTGAVDGWIFSAAAQTFLFDEGLRQQMTELNPAAVRAMADTLAEARDRDLWQPDDDESDRLDEVRDDLDDHIEGVA
ncbi:cobaltochelatase subunit CobN [Parenemella sanctibonifatiensis]|nr:cobaltochelatase subunit CobN [Parenemella sanctibonifatiensis]